MRHMASNISERDSSECGGEHHALSRLDIVGVVDCPYDVLSRELESPLTPNITPRVRALRQGPLRRVCWGGTPGERSGCETLTGVAAKFEARVHRKKMREQLKGLEHWRV